MRGFLDRMRRRSAMRAAQRAAADLPPDVSLTLVDGGTLVPVKGTLDVEAIARAATASAPDRDR